MHIALFHNHYHFRGGEDTTIDFEQAVLEDAGHRVDRFTIHNDDVFGQRRPWPILQAALSSPWSQRSYNQIKQRFSLHPPDIGHVHNWFPLITPSVYAALRDLGIPVVQTLHNYRLGCGAATLTRDNQVCELCLDGDRSHAVRHKCYRNSKIQSMIWRRTMDRNWNTGVFQELVDAYIAPSTIVAKKHKRMGLPASKIHVIPHASNDPLVGRKNDDASQLPANAGAFFFGRLSHEKGINWLLEAWRDINLPLTVAGSGPLEQSVRAMADDLPQVRLVGQLGREELLSHIQNSAFVVFPSLSYEVFGLGVIETMACGRPVIASNIGGPAELVDDEATGLLVAPNDSDELRNAVNRLSSNRALVIEMGQKARQSYLERFSPKAHLQNLMQLFESITSKGNQKSVA